MEVSGTVNRQAIGSKERRDGAQINKSSLASKEFSRAMDQERNNSPFRSSKLTQVRSVFCRARKMIMPYGHYYQHLPGFVQRRELSPSSKIQE